MTVKLGMSILNSLERNRGREGGREGGRERERENCSSDNFIPYRVSYKCRASLTEDFIHSALTYNYIYRK